MQGKCGGKLGVQETQANVCQVLSFIQFALEGADERDLTSDDTMGLHWILESAKEALRGEDEKLKQLQEVVPIKAS